MPDGPSVLPLSCEGAVYRLTMRVRGEPTEGPEVTGDRERKPSQRQEWDRAQSRARGCPEGSGHLAPSVTSHPRPPHPRPSELTGHTEAQGPDRGPREASENCLGKGVHLHEKILPSQSMRTGRSGVGTLCSAVGPQKAGRPDRVHHGLVASAPHSGRSLHR